MKLALALNAVNPAIGGVLIRGEKGTAKSTAVRALAGLLPTMRAVAGCPYACEPSAPAGLCRVCGSAGSLPVSERPAPVVDLPIGATEDRVLGTLDLERAIQEGRREFEPGLLAAAHRGILYIDEVNLLGDHLVDLLLDAAATGVNVVEREGVSASHPARFILVGTMNPEEGELRPQLLDRFGLAVDVGGIGDPDERAEIVRRRIAFEADSAAFERGWEQAEQAERARIQAAQALLPGVGLGDRQLRLLTHLCADLQVDGLRADIVIYKTACALAAYEDRATVSDEDIERAAALALPHRRRRGPFQQPRLEPDELEAAMDRAREALDRDGEDGSDDDDAERDEVFAPSDAPPATLPPTNQQPRATAPGRRARSSLPASSGAATLVTRIANEAPTPLALDATIRAAAPYQRARRSRQAATDSAAVLIEPPDLRTRARRGRTSRLVLFVVDSSGSMAARRRMEAVKGAVIQLLTDAYQKRDRVALISARGARAELLLPPTSSVGLANQRLTDLPTGGRTPLADGLRLALDTIEQARHAELIDPLLVLVSDGRPNVPLDRGDALQDARWVASRIAEVTIPAIVIDTEDGRLRLGANRELSEALRAPCIRLDELHAGAVVAAIDRARAR